jgi:hypothetical protein
MRRSHEVTRPHIEFIHEQVLPWSDGLYGGGRPGVAVRTLSLDEDTGASSLVVRYPPGWERSGPEHLPVDEEFLVLQGSIEIDGVRYDRLDYGFLPARHVRRAAKSDAGALVVTFFEGEPRPVPAGADRGSAGPLADRVRALDGDWGGGFHPRFPPGAGRKFMRHDSVTGEQTWILGTMPLRSGRRPEKHPVVEEMFLVSGELVGNLGVMHAGAYFWRPPQIWHGPYGSWTGNVMLFRTRGGPLSTVYTDGEQDFDWTPAHRPVLPAALTRLGGEPYPGQTRL